MHSSLRFGRHGIGGLAGAGLASGAVVVTLLAAPAAGGQPASAPMPHSAAAKGVVQDYDCSTPIGNAIESVGVSATARVAGDRLTLSKVTYAFVNNFGIDITINDIRFAVPDPSKKNAPYEKGSAAVSDHPAGWTAGHQKGQLVEHYAGDMDVATDATIPVAAMSAAYASKGRNGTVVKWKAGRFSFFVVDGGAIDCTPIAPFRTIASVTE